MSTGGDKWRKSNSCQFVLAHPLQGPADTRAFTFYMDNEERTVTLPSPLSGFTELDARRLIGTYNAWLSDQPERPSQHQSSDGERTGNDNPDRGVALPTADAEAEQEAAIDEGMEDESDEADEDGEEGDHPLEM